MKRPHRPAGRAWPAAKPPDPPAPWRRVGDVACELVNRKLLELELAALAAAELQEGAAR